MNRIEDYRLFRKLFSIFVAASLMHSTGFAETKRIFTFSTMSLPTQTPTPTMPHIVPARTTTASKLAKENVGSLYLLIVFAGILFILFLIFLINQMQRAQVIHHSELYKGLLSLNKKYIFNKDIPASYTLTHMVKSKQSLERADADEVFIYKIYNDPALKDIFDKITFNVTSYDEYMQEYTKLKRDISNSEATYNKKIEQKMCKEIIKKPICDIKLYLNLEYTSLKGKNHYRRSFTASYNTLLYAYKEATLRQIMRYQAQVERSKMSDALRYKVLTRDGHRCVICGATAQDGVKLHVDHILPVSKGGKTELNNLRTLCERCNLGKSNRYNENGIN